MKNLKICISTILIMAISTVAVFAGRYTLTLQDAVDLGIKNSKKVEISAKNIETNVVTLEEQYLNNFKALKGNSSMGYGTLDMSLENGKVKLGYYKRMAEIGIESSQKALEQTKVGVAFSVEKAYFNYQNSIEQAKIQEESLKIAKENEKKVKLRFNLGIANEMEVISAENATKSTKQGYNSAVRGVELARKNLCNELGIDFSEELVLKDKLSPLEYEKYDISKMVDTALEKRLDLYSANAQAELDRFNFDVTKKYYQENTYVYRKTLINAEKSEETARMAKQNVILSVYKSYDDMLDAYEKLAVMDTQIVQANKAADIANIKYEQNLGTNDEVIDANNKVNLAKLNKSQAVLQYNMAKKTFEYNCDLGTKELSYGF